MVGRRPFLLFTVLALGYAFLYGPIASLIVYSFNESRLVTVWTGFSLKWYGELARNEQMLAAAGLSLKVATLSATLAVCLGTLAALALTRIGRFRGRTLLSLMVTAPLVMPEVITGLSALLLFVALDQLVGWPSGRGMTTIVLTHVTFSLAYVTIVVRSRLGVLDGSLEEAALDLGARPLKVFFVITVPTIAPALAAGWLLAFTLSLDDLVVASFVSGPGATTLPMVVYSSVRLGVSPQINALATLIVVVVTAAIAVAGWLLHRGEVSRR
ncbi:MAG: ABC transporter permease subunit [Alphaproteobacteria bacterium]